MLRNVHGKPQKDLRPSRVGGLIAALAGIAALLAGCGPVVFEVVILSNPISRGPLGELTLVLEPGVGYVPTVQCSRARFGVFRGEECLGGTLYLYEPQGQPPRLRALEREGNVLWARFTPPGLLYARGKGWQRAELMLRRYGSQGLGPAEVLHEVPAFPAEAGLDPQGRWLTYREAPAVRVDFFQLLEDLRQTEGSQTRSGEALDPQTLRLLQQLFRATGPLWVRDLEKKRSVRLVDRAVAHRWAGERVLVLQVEGEITQEEPLILLRLLTMEPRGTDGWASRVAAEWKLDPLALWAFGSQGSESFLTVSPDGREAYVALPNSAGLYRVALTAESDGSTRVERLYEGGLGPSPSPTGRRLAFSDPLTGRTYLRESDGRLLPLDAPEAVGLFWLSERELGLAEPLPASASGDESGVSTSSPTPARVWVLDLETGERQPLPLDSPPPGSGG